MLCERASRVRHFRRRRHAEEYDPGSEAGKFPCAERCKPPDPARVEHGERSNSRAAPDTAGTRRRFRKRARRHANQVVPIDGAGGPKHSRLRVLCPEHRKRLVAQARSISILRARPRCQQSCPRRKVSAAQATAPGSRCEAVQPRERESSDCDVHSRAQEHILR